MPLCEGPHFRCTPLRSPCGSTAPEASHQTWLLPSEGRALRPADLWDQPLIISHQRSDDRRLAQWMQRDLSQLHIVATYNLVFNASLLVDEGLGYALCFDKLINTRGSSLCFRPFAPRLESTAYIIWKKYQVFSKSASAFLACLKQLTEQ